MVWQVGGWRVRLESGRLCGVAGALRGVCEYDRGIRECHPWINEPLPGGSRSRASGPSLLQPSSPAVLGLRLLLGLVALRLALLQLDPVGRALLRE